MLQWTFAQRQIMLLLLGSTGWLVAATLTAGLLEMPGSLNDQLYWFAVAMCLLNIAAYLFNGWHLYVNCVREPALAGRQLRLAQLAGRFGMPCLGAGADLPVAGTRSRADAAGAICRHRRAVPQPLYPACCDCHDAAQYRRRGFGCADDYRRRSGAGAAGAIGAVAAGFGRDSGIARQAAAAGRIGAARHHVIIAVGSGRRQRAPAYRARSA